MAEAKGTVMVEQENQVPAGKKAVIVIGSLVVAAAYFTFLDWALMDMQGLDYFYLFRK